MKNYLIHLSVLAAFSVALFGYFYFGDFGLQNSSVETSSLVEPVTKRSGDSSADTTQRGASQKASRPNVERERTSPDTAPQREPAPKDVAALEGLEGIEDNSDSPSFDVVRVEQTGETLIAGQAAPNSKVLIEKNGEVIAETTADAAGAFVALPLDAIKGENNQVVIRSVDADGTENVSNQIVAIGVPEKGEPLVALVEPGKAIEILQKPKAQQLAKVEPPKEVISRNTESDDGSLVEEASSQTKNKGARELAKEALAAKLETNSVDKEARESVNVPSQTAEETKRVARLLKPDEVSDEDVSSSADSTVRSNSSPEDEGENKQPEDKLVEDTIANEKRDTAASAPSEALDEAASKVEKETTPKPQAPTVSVEAVEVDGDKVFIAGEGKAGSSVRVYIDSLSIGDVKVGQNGRWLFEDKQTVAPGEHTIRVDQITTSTGSVSARAEVPFVVEDLTLSDLADAGSNTVIIRRNDNLWTIAQRLYGDGLKFTAIYEQNRNQIRDPNLIFPGQTFTLPAEGSKAASQN
ncbi:MAG: Ig-like domain-containing protein [Hyphomicrobiales bacterium]